MYVKPVLLSCLNAVASCVCSVQQNDQVPCDQPLPLHGYDIYHLSAKGGIWLQGHHCAAGEENNAGSSRTVDVGVDEIHLMTILLFLSRQLAKKVNNVETSWALGATFDYFRNLNIHWGQLAVAAAGTERDSPSLWGVPSSDPPLDQPPPTQP